METFNSIIKASSHNHFFISVLVLSAAVLTFLYPFLLKLIVFFSPLLFSIAVCYLLILSKEKQYREILFMEGEKGRGGVAQVCEEANLSLYDGHIGAGFLFWRGGEKLKCALEEEEEGQEEDNVIFGGKIDVGSSTCEFVETVDSYVVDCLAERLWNSYFGRFSKWNHFETVLEEGDWCEE